MEKRWRTRGPIDQGVVQTLQKELGVSDKLAALMVLRGITTYDQAKSFFRPASVELHDPFLMNGMQSAVKRLEEAINNDQRIMVYGDYDVDGTSAVSAVYTYLQLYTQNIEYYIPDRYKEGYGLSMAGIEAATKSKVELLITLDCGIKAVEQVKLARQNGIDVIVCDHHLPGDIVPDCFILNPKKPECEYPYKELTGCGVGFKFMHAFGESQGNGFDSVRPLLDLVALSIAADIVPITGENRSLMALGLELIHQGSRVGMRSILEPLGKLDSASVSDLVFTIAPRINAAGRMESGLKAVQLLSATDPDTAQELNTLVTNYNDQRREVEQAITEEALERLRQDDMVDHMNATVVYDPGWHKGVIGIVASRLIEKYHRPTIVLTDSGDHVAGSVRSVRGFDVYQALEASQDHLIQFGGHKYAAGLTIKRENIDAFRKKFDQVVRDTIEEDARIPEIQIDLELTLNDIQGNSFDAIPKFYRVLEQFAPFGPGNMRPTFVVRNLTAAFPRVVGEDHLQFTVFEDAMSQTRYKCIAFRQGEKMSLLDKPIDLAFTLEKNVWQNRESLQLNVKDIKASRRS